MIFCQFLLLLFLSNLICCLPGAKVFIQIGPYNYTLSEQCNEMERPVNIPIMHVWSWTSIHLQFNSNAITLLRCSVQVRDTHGDEITLVPFQQWFDNKKQSIGIPLLEKYLQFEQETDLCFAMYCTWPEFGWFWRSHHANSCKWLRIRTWVKAWNP